MKGWQKLTWPTRPTPRSWLRNGTFQRTPSWKVELRSSSSMQMSSFAARNMWIYLTIAARPRRQTCQFWFPWRRSLDWMRYSTNNFSSDAAPNPFQFGIGLTSALAHRNDQSQWQPPPAVNSCQQKHPLNGARSSRHSQQHFEKNCTQCCWQFLTSL